MYVQAIQLYESEGRPLPRHRMAFLKPKHEGWLVYKESYDLNHKRTMMKAQLFLNGGEQEVFPELLDAVMMIAEDSVMTIRGLERDPITRKLTAMAWWCKVLKVGRRGYAGDSDGPTIV